MSNGDHCFSATATLLLYLDADSRQVTGAWTSVNPMFHRPQSAGATRPGAFHKPYRLGIHKLLNTKPRECAIRTFHKEVFWER